ncbi:MAG: efflux RND transporter periplasmic adaptor subunit [Candidatus Sumerlaeaceae bacterium]|nr:efflux RND transporter periplasmic adaptor subunit [Candidatus Sumerlaeaceae bacterium]
MNPEIDLNTFGGVGVAPLPGHVTDREMVAPPRRVLTRYVVPSVLLAGFLLTGGYAIRGSILPAVPVKVVMPVLTAVTSSSEGATVEVASGTPLFQAPGWVEPDPFHTVVSSLEPGIVTHIHVREGEQVTSGQVVAELDDGEAQLAVKSAEAALEITSAELESAQANWDNPTTLREALKAAKAEKTRLHAEKKRSEDQLKIARQQAEINQSLSTSGAGGKFDATKANLEFSAGEAGIKEIEAKLEAQVAIIEAAEERLKLRLDDRQRLTKAKAENHEAQAALAQARLKLERTRIVAPTSGTVMALYANPGSMVSMAMEGGMRILHMYDPNKLQVRAEVPLADAAKIRIGLPAEIHIEAMPDRTFHGEITRVVHQADIQRNSLQVKARILDPDPALKPEMIVRVQFTSPKSEARPADHGTSKTMGASSLFVPESLAQSDAHEAKLWFVAADQTAHQRTVTFGSRKRGNLREVTAGVEPPDKIIVSGAEKLSEGSRVKIAAME